MPQNLHVLEKLREGELWRGGTLVTSVMKALVASSVQPAGLLKTAGDVTRDTYVAAAAARAAAANYVVFRVCL